jgi:hypothetical protein
MNWEQRQIQTAAFIFMLVRALLIMPAVLLKASVSLFDAPGTDDNVPVIALTYRWLLFPFFLRLQRAAICQGS